MEASIILILLVFGALYLFLIFAALQKVVQYANNGILTPTATLVWLVLIVMVPFLGSLIFLMFGNSSMR